MIDRRQDWQRALTVLEKCMSLKNDVWISDPMTLTQYSKEVHICELINKVKQ